MEKNNIRKPRITITDSIINIVKIQHDRGKKDLDIANETNLSLSTVKNLLHKICNGLESSDIIKKKGRKKNHDPIINNLLLSIVNEDNSLNQTGISDAMRISGRPISQPTISKKLKMLKITRKRLIRVPLERNLDRIINLRYKYAREMENIDLENIVYMDETGFNRHTMSNYGYSSVNTKAYAAVPGNRGINISLLCSISSRGVIGYRIKEGAFNGDLLLEYLENIILPYFNENPSSILIMDNCRFHHRLDVKEFLNLHHIVHKYIAPYSPQLNGIEEFFALLKSRYNSIRPRPRTAEQIKDCVKEKLDGIDTDLYPYYMHARSQIPLCLSRNHMI